jgi:hypothetical protein
MTFDEWRLGGDSPLLYDDGVLASRLRLDARLLRGRMTRFKDSKRGTQVNILSLLISPALQRHSSPSVREKHTPC